MSVSDNIRRICATAGQGISSAITHRRSPSAYEQLSAEEDDLEMVQDQNAVIPSAPALTEEEGVYGTTPRNNGYALGVSSHSSSSTINKAEHKAKTSNRQYSRATPSGRSRLLETIPRKKKNNNAAITTRSIF
eukprot:CAMPEP_0185271530 /NCGR_PEP_ID=MMETSP1359-20130426/44996_1 /TAXON_ID=552665 /ORGANISM="Bigelowiella longifila, Strain CCMP242" /LENGTH=132 /DNA_ID=CAMNT_0027863507 /DNA_START=944 /DNA_END=1342 /DNA_ORIENTATION=+